MKDRPAAISDRNAAPARVSPSFMPRSYTSRSRRSVSAFPLPLREFVEPLPSPSPCSSRTAAYWKGSECDSLFVAFARSNDVGLILLRLQHDFPLGLQPPRGGHDLLLRCVHIPRAQRPQRVHVFLQHLHGPGRHALKEMVSQVF